MAINLGVKLGAAYFDVTLGAIGTVRIRPCRGERKKNNEHGAFENIHSVFCAFFSNLVSCSSGLWLVRMLTGYIY
jgi:hypothetical protein